VLLGALKKNNKNEWKKIESLYFIFFVRKKKYRNNKKILCVDFC
jgi:hypothetical protein